MPESGAAKKDVASQYNIPRNTLSTWLKNKDYKIVKAFEGEITTSNKSSEQATMVIWTRPSTGGLFKSAKKVHLSMVPY